jgi:CRISPR-associated endoribonuclease Cas6
MRKYKLLYGKELDNSDFYFRFCQDYIQHKKGQIQKKIQYKNAEIIGFLAPFEIKCDPVLIQTGYEAGFGEKGSMGFGMAKVLPGKHKHINMER